MTFGFRWAAVSLMLATPVAVAPVAAAEIGAADRAALEARIAAFDKLIADGRLGEVVDFLPPRLLAFIAKNSGVTEAELRPALTAQMNEVMKTVKMLSFGMDMQKATVATTPNGARDYMLIPTETLMQIPDGQKLHAKSSTVALKDDGQWYVVRIDNAQQILMLRKVYPEFAGVDFPSGSMAAVE